VYWLYKCYLQRSTIVYSTIERVLDLDCTLSGVHQTVHFSVAASANDTLQISISVWTRDPSVNDSSVFTTLFMQILYQLLQVYTSCDCTIFSLGMYLRSVENEVSRKHHSLQVEEFHTEEGK
jgi:hypothetical protein